MPISESIQDIIMHTMTGDANSLQTALDCALKEKISQALDTKKHDISKNLVGLGEAKMSNSTIEKKAHKGENVGHGGFGKVAASAAKEYGSKEAGEKVAASVMWKKYGHKK